MKYAIIWKYTDSDGEVRVLTASPGSFCDSAEEAKEEGRQTLAELPDYALQPLCVVQADEDTVEDVLACEEVYLGTEPDDLLFYDISGTSTYARQSWWPL